MSYVVLIKDNRSRSESWPLAGVTDLHPGSDGFVRAVTLEAEDTMVKGPIVKICHPPVAEDIAAQTSRVQSPSSLTGAEIEGSRFKTRLMTQDFTFYVNIIIQYFRTL